MGLWGKGGHGLCGLCAILSLIISISKLTLTRALKMHKTLTAKGTNIIMLPSVQTRNVSFATCEIDVKQQTYFILCINLCPSIKQNFAHGSMILCCMMQGCLANLC